MVGVLLGRYGTRAAFVIMFLASALSYGTSTLVSPSVLSYCLTSVAGSTRIFPREVSVVARTLGAGAAMGRGAQTRDTDGAFEFALTVCCFALLQASCPRQTR